MVVLELEREEKGNCGVSGLGRLWCSANKHDRLRGHGNVPDRYRFAELFHSTAPFSLSSYFLGSLNPSPTYPLCLLPHNIRTQTCHDAGTQEYSTLNPGALHESLTRGYKLHVSDGISCYSPITSFPSPSTLYVSDTSGIPSRPRVPATSWSAWARSRRKGNKSYVNIWYGPQVIRQPVLFPIHADAFPVRQRQRQPLTIPGCANLFELAPRFRSARCKAASPGGLYALTFVPSGNGIVWLYLFTSLSRTTPSPSCFSVVRSTFQFTIRRFVR